MSPEDLDAHREHVARHAVHFSTDSRTALDWCAKRTQKAVQEVASERDALAAQISALRPVVEAARKWAPIYAGEDESAGGQDFLDASDALLAALRTYESQQSENPGELKP